MQLHRVLRHTGEVDPEDIDNLYMHGIGRRLFHGVERRATVGHCLGVALPGCHRRAGADWLLHVLVAGGRRVADSGGPGSGVRWRVFISHTSELRDFPADGSYAGAVERAISACGHVVVDMADFPAADQVPAEMCRERVRGCEVYVGVLGTRYGSPVRDEPDVS